VPIEKCMENANESKRRKRRPVSQAIPHVAFCFHISIVLALAAQILPYSSGKNRTY